MLNQKQATKKRTSFTAKKAKKGIQFSKKLIHFFKEVLFVINPKQRL